MCDIQIKFNHWSFLIAVKTILEGSLMCLSVK